MKRNFTIFLVAFLVLSLSKAEAQVLAANYSFSSSISTYSPISNGTELGDDFNDDNLFDDVPIGFTFTFCGVPHTSVCISSNGYFKFGYPINVATQIPLSNPNSDDTIVSVLAADLESNTNGTLTYTTIGSAPNQIFILQWEDYTYYGEFDNFYFQIRLHQTSNVIEYHYGSFYCDNVSNAYQVGLRGHINTDWNNRRVVSSLNTWATSNPGTANNHFCEISPTPFIPSNGQRYVWSPPCPAPNITVTASSPTVCSGLPVTFTASGATSYTWSTSASTNTMSVNPSATTFYTVTGSSAPSCTAQITCSVGVVQGPVISLNAQPTASFCPGMTGTLVASGATGYTWNPTGSNFAIINIAPTANTTYTIMGENAQGCKTTTMLSIYMTTCTSIYNSNNAHENINIYPNPSNGKFVIEFDNGFEKQIDVMDVTGRIVLNKIIQNDKTDVNIVDLPNGVYYVKIKSNNVSKVLKLVKE